MSELGAFIGEWRMAVAIPDAPQGRHDEARGTLLQHCFDSRGVARVYEMGLEDRVWTFSRSKPDFSPLTFWQRWKGTFSEDGRTIEGDWELSHDEGATWEHDFRLTFRKVD